MRKSNTDATLLTPDFVRMCLSNGLLFASVYMVLLSPYMSMRLYLLFAVGMLAVGPFHAYLGDAYKRKHVYLWSVLGLMACAAGYGWVTDSAGRMLLSFLQGASFGLATTAGITLSIDITTSERRTEANVQYALAGRVGMLAGIAGALWTGDVWLPMQTLYLSLAVGLLSLLLAARVYVAFRAPIGVGWISADRFFLPRAWLPALNVWLRLFPVGVFLPLMFAPQWRVAGLVVIAFLVLQTALSWTGLFINLSQHCQRGTANTTCCLSIDLGILSGLALCYGCLASGTSLVALLVGALSAAVLSLLLYLSVTRPYYRKHRVR